MSRLFSFPALLLAICLICAGFAVHDFFLQAADKFVAVNAGLSGQ